MKITCLLLTTSYRGDHSADVKIAIEPFTNETVNEFAKRILGHDDSFCDLIEIRLTRSEAL